MRGWNWLPRFRLNIGAIFRKAEREGLLTYDSDIKDVHYVADKDELIIMRVHKGYVRLNKNELETLTYEVSGIREDMRHRRH